MRFELLVLVLPPIPIKFSLFRKEIVIGTQYRTKSSAAAVVVKTVALTEAQATGKDIRLKAYNARIDLPIKN